MQDMGEGTRGLTAAKTPSREADFQMTIAKQYFRTTRSIQAFTVITRPLKYDKTTGTYTDN